VACLGVHVSGSCKPVDTPLIVGLTLIVVGFIFVPLRNTIVDRSMGLVNHGQP